MYPNNECRPAQSARRDRAALLVGALLGLIEAALQDPELRCYLEALVRDELADVKREVAGERQADFD
jgi:hypothetical protein